MLVRTNLLQWTFSAAQTIYNPIISEGRVYFADLSKTVYCLDQATGGLLWTFDLVETSRKFGRPSAVAGKIKYPVIKESYLYLSDATALYCLDKYTGIVLWARAGLNDTSQVSGLNDSIYADPILADFRVIYGTRKYFMARNYTNGHVLWYNPAITSFGGFPSFYNNSIFTQSKDLSRGRFIVYCLNAGDGTVRWEKDIDNSFQIFNPVIYRDRVYIASGKKLYCLGLHTGDILWTREYDELITSGPGFTDRHILFSLGNNQVVVTDPDNGKINYSFPSGEASSPSFVIIRDQIYLASLSPTGQGINTTILKAYSFDQKGKTLWTFRTTEPGGPSQPVADKGVIYLPAGKTLYAIGKPGQVTIQVDPSLVVIQPTNTTVIQLDDMKKGDSVIVNNIYFELNKSYLHTESLEVLDQIVAQLKKHPRISMEIRGHTDSSGDHDYNQILSEKRAETVRDYLIKNGISPHRLSTAGFGQDRPIASNDTEQGRALNRRTEFYILEK